MANVKDFAAGIVLTAPSPATTGTTFELRAGEADTMPTPPFFGTFTPPGSLTTIGTSEKVRVTAINATTKVLTMDRALSPTTAKAIDQGWIFANAMYTDDIFTSSQALNQSFTGTIDGTNAVFTLAAPATSIVVYKNGVRMRPGSGNDYIFTNNNTVTFQTGAIPLTGAALSYDAILGSALMVNGSNSLATDEVPTGTVNGTNTAFTTVRPYIPGTLEVFINGIKQARVTHFAETTPTTGIFTMGDAPLTGDNIIVNYQFVASVTGNADTVDGYHANATPTANSIPVLGSTGRMPVSTQKAASAKVTIGGTGQSIANTSFVSLAFASEIWDTDAMHDTTTNNTRVYAQYAGIYDLTVNLLWSSSTPWGTGRVIVNLKRNGTVILEMWDGTIGGSQAEPSHGHSTVFDASVGDYFEIEIYQGTGGSKTLDASTAFIMTHRGALT